MSNNNQKAFSQGAWYGAVKTEEFSIDAKSIEPRAGFYHFKDGQARENTIFNEEDGIFIDPNYYYALDSSLENQTALQAVTQSLPTLYQLLHLQNAVEIVNYRLNSLSRSAQTFSSNIINTCWFQECEKILGIQSSLNKMTASEDKMLPSPQGTPETETRRVISIKSFNTFEPCPEAHIYAGGECILFGKDEIYTLQPDGYRLANVQMYGTIENIDILTVRSLQNTFAFYRKDGQLYYMGASPRHMSDLIICSAAIYQICRDQVHKIFEGSSTGFKIVDNELTFKNYDQEYLGGEQTYHCNNKYSYVKGADGVYALNNHSPFQF